MPSFSSSSIAKLNTCHPELQRLFKQVIKHYDCTILEGHRTPERQAELFKQGKSQVRVSKHNSNPSLAVDVKPYKAAWTDNESFYHFGGFVKAMALALSIDIRWGGDWDGDFEFKDQDFNDLVHFELKG